MSEDTIAGIIIYVFLCFVLPFLAWGGKTKYWEIVAGFHFVGLLGSLAALVICSLVWAITVVLS